MPDILIERENIDFLPNSKVKEVVVFSDKAMVKRSMKIVLKKGENLILFSNLGRDINEDSIKARVPIHEVKILSTGLVVNNLYFFKNKENEKLYGDMIENLKSIIAVSDRIRINAVCSNIIDDLRNYIGMMQNNIILEKEVSMHKLREALSFLETKLKENRTETLELNEEHAKISEAINVLYQQMENVKHLDSKTQTNIEVVLYSDIDMEIDIDIDYMLPNVSWHASYDSVLDRNDGEIDFYYFGNIIQHTGEDWIDTKLSLSTAVVENTMILPQIYPVYIESYYQKRDKELVLDEKKIKDGFEMAGEVPEEEAPSGPGRVVSEKKTVSHNFVIDKTVSIPSDGMSHKVTVFNGRMKGDVFYETIPELMPHIYLKSGFINNTGLPFLSGTNSIYRNWSFMGISHLKYISHGEKADISFGIDDDLRVRRFVMINSYEKSKNIMDKNIWNKKIKFVFNNYSGMPKKAVLKEGIYVSELKEVEITIDRETTTGYQQDKEGIISWTVDLPDDPLTFVEVILSYRMESSRNFDMSAFY